jgi:predicted branched-subunit amino acid permease
MLPLTLAYVPFGLLVGAAVGDSAHPVAAWFATFAIYGGAAHLATLDVLAEGSGWLAAAAVGLLVNARLGAYAAAMAPSWQSATTAHRAAAAVVLTDAPWALAEGYRATAATARRTYYFGAALTLFVSWPALVTAGVLAADRITVVAGSDLLPALTLGALVAPQLRRRPAAFAATASALTALATAHLGGGAALLLCAAAGVAAALGAGSLERASR